MIPKDFKGRAKRLDDIDLPKLGARIGVGEDEIHAVLDVESRGTGFDKQGRPLILFEPHIFWRELGPGPKRQEAQRAGLAYPNWGMRPYPKDSYPRLIEAMKIDETAALKSASWGLGQVLGSNYRAAGFDTVQDMVEAFCHDEEHHLSAMVGFIKTNRLDDELRRHDWAGFARGYNGPGYAKHDYHGRLARAYARWSRIKDTKWNPADAVAETEANEAPQIAVQTKEPAPAVTVPAKSIPRQPDDPGPRAPPVKPGFWKSFWAALTKRAST